VVPDDQFSWTSQGYRAAAVQATPLILATSPAVIGPPER
jgi:hypothetical protein